MTRVSTFSDVTTKIEIAASWQIYLCDCEFSHASLRREDGLTCQSRCRRQSGDRTCLCGQQSGCDGLYRIQSPTVIQITCNIDICRNRDFTAGPNWTYSGLSSIDKAEAFVRPQYIHSVRKRESYNNRKICLSMVRRCVRRCRYKLPPKSVETAHY